jgi:hypothetical protein
MFAFPLVSVVLICSQAASEFEIRTIGRAIRSARLDAMTADGSLTIAGEKTAAGEWYSLRRSPGILPDWPRLPHVELVNGDRIRGTVTEADGDLLRLKLAIPGKEQVVRFPLSALRVAWLARRPIDDPAWLTAPRKRDVFQSRNGDLSTGAMTAIDVERGVVRYQSDGKEHQLDLSRIAAVGFNTDLARARKPKGPYYRITLLDGSRLSVLSMARDSSTWIAQTLFKDSIRIAHEQVVSVDVEQGRCVWLSDLKPDSYQYHSFDGEQHSWSPDRNANGDALRLKWPDGESTFDRGVGLHAECTITYALAGKYSRFEALAGLDARTGIRGEAILSIQVDGKEQALTGGGKLTFAGGPLAVSVDVKGAKALKITVRRGNGGHVQDQVNLAEARLVP